MITEVRRVGKRGCHPELVTGQDRQFHSAEDVVSRSATQQAKNTFMIGRSGYRAERAPQASSFPTCRLDL